MKRTRRARRALPAMTPGPKPRRRHVHKHLVGLFAVAAAFLVVLNIAVILTPSHQALATVSENVDGWAWSSTGGWLSMNNTNAGAGGGSYGVNIDPVTKVVTGYAWSSNQGWVCFGSSCAGTTPAGGVATSSIDGSNRLHGWAKFINLTDPDGWISLNCADTGGAGSCATSNYGPTVSPGTGLFSGYAWHGLGGGLGWGWIEFSGVRMSTTTEGTILRCHDGIDNNLNGLLDCSDLACKQQPALNCPAVETQCGLIGHTNCCYDGDDDDNDAANDCADSDCNAASCGTGCVCGGGIKTETLCGDGLDNDGDTLADCSDANCIAFVSCIPEICDNTIDDNSNGQIDCADATCNGFPACTPAWLKSQYGNVYSKLGISGNPPPAGMSNATYCLTSGGAISFTSETSCVEASQSATLNLPTSGSGYVSNLGRLDITGILSGRYGTKVNISSEAGLPGSGILDGKVYVYDKVLQGGCPAGGNFVLNAKTFNNGSGSTQRGNGLLVIKGCNLRIAGNLSYQAAGVSTYLRNLASFGVIVLSEYSGGVWVSGGDVSIDPTVSQIVGLYFGERTIRTGTTGAVDIQLKVYGALVGHEVLLQRRFGSATEGAEDVIFDGRGVVNPPPGTQDITKSLPTLSDTF